MFAEVVKKNRKEEKMCGIRTIVAEVCFSILFLSLGLSTVIEFRQNDNETWKTVHIQRFFYYGIIHADMYAYAQWKFFLKKGLRTKGLIRILFGFLFVALVLSYSCIFVVSIDKYMRNREREKERARL